jgi:spore coat-associated protein N
MIKQFVKHPRRTIAGLATVLAAAGVAVGSGATFTAQSANPTNTFTAGTLLHSNSKGDGVTIVTGSNLKPGDVRTGETTIKNTGTLAGTFKLSEVNDSNAFRAGVLDLVVDEVSGGVTRNVYTGDLGGLGSVALGSFAPDESRTYKYSVTVDAVASNNDDQGKAATADYVFDQAPAS